MEERTYGIYSLEFKGFTTKEIREIGFVHDVKWVFNRNAKPDWKFELDHTHVLFGAAETDGLKLEIRPRVNGEHLPGILLPTTLQGNLTTVPEGVTRFVTRIADETLTAAGLSCAAFLNCSFALECTVGDMPTLEESMIQQELQAEKQVQQDVQDLVGQIDGSPIFGGQEAPDAHEQNSGPETPEQFLARAQFGQLSTLLQAIGRDPGEWSDPKQTDDEAAAEWRALLFEHWPQLVESGALEGMYEVAEPEEEDMPFPPSQPDSGTQPSA
ncbi:hypothetical protein [Deinococcus hopiensis]|uniref:Uncharacterized protein n=1 Tax=Deinococcus hopiensis KR-140 TaxID=695939 RepID=A0A1W1V780_9DEIO|nr:hypothetical protein [Deinococcus hopiensis]SMB89155.1 hypothetical protein SAMN00790413_00288 [Deinococcus hopiensis KR-140]